MPLNNTWPFFFRCSPLGGAFFSKPPLSYALREPPFHVPFPRAILVPILSPKNVDPYESVPSLGRLFPSKPFPIATLTLLLAGKFSRETKPPGTDSPPERFFLLLLWLSDGRFVGDVELSSLQDGDF